MVEDGLSVNLNLEGHLNRFTGSKVTAILVNWGILPGVELHQEWSAPAACAAGLFLDTSIVRIFRMSTQ